MITPAQSRAARALLDWTQEDLAKAAHLGLSTIRDFEKGRRTPTYNNLLGIKSALESVGIIFIEPQSDWLGLKIHVKNVGSKKCSKLTF